MCECFQRLCILGHHGAIEIGLLLLLLLLMLSKDKTAFITRFINVPLLGASSLVTLIFSSDVQDIFFILKIQNTILSCVFQKVSWKMKY